MIKRKKKRKHPKTTLFIVLLTVLMSSMTVFAGEQTTVMIPISCVAKNTSEVFQYELKLENTEFQEHQIIGSDIIRLSNNETGNFEITFDYPGTYQYTIRQKKGVASNTTYDNTVFQVCVYVNAETSGRLSASTVAYIKGTSEKKSKIEFLNTATTTTSEPDSNPDSPVLNPDSQEPDSSDLNDNKDTNSSDLNNNKDTNSSNSIIQTGDDSTLLYNLLMILVLALMSVHILRKIERKHEHGKE